MFTEDLSVYFADFGEDCTVQGASVRGIFNKASMMELGEYLGADITLEVPGTVTAADGGAVVVRGATYTIRQVLDQPPDGALRTLVLAA